MSSFAIQITTILIKAEASTTQILLARLWHY